VTIVPSRWEIKAQGHTGRYDVEMRSLYRLLRTCVQISTLILCLSFAPANAETKDLQPVAAAADPKAAAKQLLDEEEATELAQRSEEPGPEIAGGALTNQQLTYIVIALAAAVIVLLVK
jgi:hypothetical protein